MNRITLAKQGLLERRRAPLAPFVGRLGGLHAQLPTTPALSLLARLRGVGRSSVEEALRRRRLVKRWLMRGTLHIVPTAELPIYHQALRGAWRSSLGRFLERQGLPPREVRLAVLYPLVLRVLRAGPLPRREIEARVRALLSPELRGREGFSAWGGSFKEMSYEGLLVHAPSRGGEAPLASVEQWLPGIDLEAVDEAEALRALVRRYFAAYGPATADDLAAWSGIPRASLRPALEGLEGELLGVTVVGQGRRFWTLRGDRRLLSRVEGVEPPPRFLPRYDVLLLAHRDRSRIIDPLHLRRIALPAGQMEATFLVGGRVAGTWGLARRGKALIVTLAPFRPLPRDLLPALREEAALLADFYGAPEVELRGA